MRQTLSEIIWSGAGKSFQRAMECGAAPCNISLFAESEMSGYGSQAVKYVVSTKGGKPLFGGTMVEGVKAVSETHGNLLGGSGLAAIVVPQVPFAGRSTC